MYVKLKDEKNIKGLYKTTNMLCNKKDILSPQQYVVAGKLYRKASEMANLQLEHYIEKVKAIREKIPISLRNPHRYLDYALEKWRLRDMRETFHFKEITLSDADRLIQTLHNSAAFGHDRLDSVSFKSARPHLVRPIQHLVNLSLRNSKCAMKWKFSAISPRLKSNELDKRDVSSYRPVACLTTTSKLVERIAQQQLLHYMESSQQMNASSHAYRKYCSTTTTLADIIDELFQGAEDKKVSAIMAIDQTAAFDCADKEILLQKLERYNVGTEARAWIEDYLSSRTQYVRIGTEISRMAVVSTGVPQGSIIGPLLYAILTNELTEVVKDRSCNRPEHDDTENLFGTQCTRCGILSVYADDSTYTLSSHNRTRNQILLARNIEEIGLYLNDNLLAINMGKTQITECMVQQKRTKLPGQPPKLEIRLDNGRLKEIKDTEYTRILGGNIQENLLWSTHLETGKKALYPTLEKTIGISQTSGQKNTNEL